MVRGGAVLATSGMGQEVCGPSEDKHDGELLDAESNRDNRRVVGRVDCAGHLRASRGDEDYIKNRDTEGESTRARVNQ